MYPKESYLVKKLPKGDFAWMVLTLGNSRVDELLGEIEISLKTKKVKGKIAFDFLLMNGLKDRFYSADFNGRTFNLTSFKPLQNPGVVSSASNKYFAKNISIIDNSNLPKTKKFLYKRAIGQS
ncbi:RnlB antitoxin of RnlAB toxin-antitoxin system [Salegentibacter sp. 24]|jgi:hypothetical protein|uniref:type II toxin-antitoxin system RnlB family antitoxin n=1 Tax=Salegentibacter sp. 24 TaxID=2183986 RepID=UPI00105B8E80|nr:type II toxin-antitoxin system RnlB family antitoxin [Salegentibacter sp. 24]TDN93376.1 RnlB antitoxin of RnlAB toxin-antitoxin system [Salegentibacter sp. 24]